MGRLAVKKAVILAGGRGSGLCPLDCYYPKASFPLGPEPLAAHLLSFLERSGVTEAAILGAAGREWDDSFIVEAADKSRLRLSRYSDDGSTGTAGSLRRADAFFGTDHFFLMQPNLYIQALDLCDIAETHLQRGSGVTVVVENRRGFVPEFEYLELDGRGRVKRFNIPHYSTNGDPSIAFTGLYVFDPRVFEKIDRGYTDIKEQLLPLLYESGVSVEVYRAKGVVHKIYTLEDYFQVHRHVLFNGVQEQGSFMKPKTRIMERVWVGRNVTVSPRADLIGPLVIDDNCTICDGARIVGPTTIGGNSWIGPDARVRECIIWPGSRLNAGSSVEFSLVADNCVVPEDGRVTNSLLIDGRKVGGRYDFLSTLAPRRVLGVEEKGRLHEASSRSARWRIGRAGKRLFDVIFGTLGLVLSAPLFVPICAAIKLTSKGPIFFKQIRCGRNGRPFNIIKFRTMVKGAEKIQGELVKDNLSDGPMFKLKRDPRVTPLGRFLRKTSLDELPQLLNVVWGQMSLVGPRPLAMHEMTLAPSWRDIRLSVKPGVTGLWQVNSRSSPHFSDWLRWDVEYVVHQSFLLDMKILFKTAVVLKAGSGGM